MKSLYREWKEEEVAFGSKQRIEFFSRLDEDQAQSLKDQGNKKFKQGLFDEAVKLYTEALNCVPYCLEVNNARKDGSRW